ncbi:Hypothetical protein SCLAV_1139 [Streptomyces clavuligerus]|uniref:Uncharacterized protein n=1 Tax=Streptomyces clavuligerus TaxID=1901 RepID=E2PYJ5_STRCL|nr:Hypothetical protein SCLAV_1139 [Streptomyces clavuligerus]
MSPAQGTGFGPGVTGRRRGDDRTAHRSRRARLPLRAVRIPWAQGCRVGSIRQVSPTSSRAVGPGGTA